MIPNEDIAPVVLTRVCRQWRALALSTPQLWSRLRLKTPYEQIDDSEVLLILQRFLRMLRTYLSRSGTVSLSLDIDLISSLYDTHAMGEVTNNRLISSIISELLPHSHQWHHLSLSAPLQYLLPVIKLIGHGSATRLNSLTLDFTYDTAYPDLSLVDSEHRPLNISLDVSSAGRLSAFTLYGNSDETITIRWDPESLPASLTRVMLWNVGLDTNSSASMITSSRPTGNSLRNLHLCASISSADLFFILWNFPNLEELTTDVQFINGGVRGVTFDQNIRLSNLRKLRISVSESTVEILDQLHVPSLKQLEFTTEQGPEGWGLLSKLTSLMRRSEPSLKSFMLYDGLGNVREDELIELLQCMSTLEEMRILTQGLSDRILQALTVKTKELFSGVQMDERMEITDIDPAPLDATETNLKSLCPNLISITFAAGNDFSAQAVVDLILSRFSLRDQLQDVSMSDPSSVAVPPATDTFPSSDLIQDNLSDRVSDPDSISVAPVSLKIFQAVLEHCKDVTENDEIRQCVNLGLVLNLRDAKQFIPLHDVL